jgi:hypothetical protein
VAWRCLAYWYITPSKSINMSFGFSVGDFITLVDHASKIWKDFLGAPAQFKAITDEYALLWAPCSLYEVN